MNAWRLLLGFVLAVAAGAAAHAEPYLAVRSGLKCMACHVNPTGGGLRTVAGNAYAQGVLAANPLPDALTGWTGSLLDDRLRLGGDLRTSTTRTAVPGRPSGSAGGLQQTRLYADVQVIKDWLGAYLDERVAPGNSERLEAYVRVQTPGLGWYAKAGQFYLPFGWRLQDNLAFVRQLSGVSMTVPDKGLEIGHERDDWSIQVAYTNGPGNRGGSKGHQLTGQVFWLQPWGRVGASMARTSSTGGDRQAYGFVAATNTGPVTWLGELDVVSDDGYPEGRRRQLAALLEADWLVRQGHNLKGTTELLDPDRRVGHDHKMRYGIVYEYTPVGFAQLRAGYRRYFGIPQNAVDNRRETFIELHALF